jgi:hypothetical protein
MDPCLAVDVTVRLAGTHVGFAHVLPGERLVVGRTREVHVALDVPTFCMIESSAHGFALRRAADAPLASLEREVPIELVFGEVTITIELVTFAPPPLPMKLVEQRPLAYGLGSTIAHCGLLLVAVLLAKPEDSTIPGTEDTKRRPTRVARFAVEAQTVKKEEKPAPDALPITTDDTPTDQPKLDDPAAASIPTLPSEQPPSGPGEKKLPKTPDSVENVEETLSNPRAFDPDDNPAFDTVKVGNFSTVSTGKAGGEQYELAGANGNRKPLIVVSCDSTSCLVIGGETAQDVRNELQKRLPEIVACYEKYSDSAGKKVELDFGIDDKGKVDTVNIGGVGDYDSCVAKIINSIQFGK